MSVLRVDLEPGEAATALAWLEGFLSRYDLSKLSRLSIDHGKGSRPRRGVWGRCYYPIPGVEDGTNSTYRISCHVGHEWGCGIRTRKEPLHRRPDGSWTPRTSMTYLNTVGEGVAWIVAHELFHFLSHTGQVGRQNTEIAADAFANDRLAKFRDVA